MRAVLATFLLAVIFVATAPAQPVPHRHLLQLHHRHVAQHRVVPHHVAVTQRKHQHLHIRQKLARVIQWFGPDARPRKWCGWFMRQIFHVADREYNRAAKWAHWGRWSAGPRVGAVVVWWHHVGLIEGGPDLRGQWLVRSGNDANAVRTRYMSLAKAIAFRMP
jgi:hypothetical protein